MENNTPPPTSHQPAFDVVPPNQRQHNHTQPSSPIVPSHHHKPPRSERSKNIISTVLILLAAPVIALILTAFVFQSYEVSGPSMETTLENNDRLIVVKTERTWARITHHAYIPNRGDIIVFDKRGLIDESQGQDKQLIKRVIGLPGDHVVVSDGVLTIYNKQSPNGFQPDKVYPWGKVITTTTGNVDLTVGQDEVFVCGDNRPNSLDSRTFGPIPAKDIIGKLVVRLLPIDKAQTF